MFDDTTCILDMAGIIPAVRNCGVVDIGIISVICLCVGTIISTIRLILELWRSESSELFSTVKLGWSDWLSHIWERLKPPPRRVLPWRSFGVWCRHKLQRLGEWLAWRNGQMATTIQWSSAGCSCSQLGRRCPCTSRAVWMAKSIMGSWSEMPGAKILQGHHGAWYSPAWYAPVN